MSIKRTLFCILISFIFAAVNFTTARANEIPAANLVQTAQSDIKKPEQQEDEAEEELGEDDC